MRFRSGLINVSEGKKFLYEVCLYKDYPDRVELVDNRFYSSNNPISYNPYKAIKMDGYVLVKTISWLEAPIDYLISNGFKEVTENENIRRKRKSNSGRRKG